MYKRLTILSCVFAFTCALPMVQGCSGPGETKVSEDGEKLKQELPTNEDEMQETEHDGTTTKKSEGMRPIN